ncbi:MAG: HpcH/HpaI aldolase family protein [Desulfurococcales archaeon]
MNKLVEKALKGEVLLGTWITIDSPEVSEAISTLSIDWVVIDMEHAPLDIYDVELLLMGLKGSNVVGIVRVPWNDPVHIKRVLDVGAQGVLAPWINTYEEAQALERAVIYPPKGIRGVGPRRATMYGSIPKTEYYKRYLEDLVVLAQIETSNAVENLEKILEVKTLTGIFVGPSDLSASLGVFGEMDSPILVGTLEKIARTARTKPIRGIMAYTPEEAARAIKMGYNMISLSSDMSNMLRGLRTFMHDIEKLIK